MRNLKRVGYKHTQGAGCFLQALPKVDIKKTKLLLLPTKKNRTEEEAFSS
jgi:hypothetical protein